MKVSKLLVIVDLERIRTQLCTGASVAGAARPALPVQVFAEDFSLLIRHRRLRIARGRVSILS